MYLSSTDGLSPKSRYSIRGNAVLQVMVAISVISVMFYFISTRVVAQRKQLSKAENIVDLRFALNSVMDYVIFGVRQKYCFTNDDLMMNDTPVNCDFKHDGSVERLLLSDGQEAFIEAAVAKGVSVGPINLQSIGINSISRYFEISKATTTHPLYPVVSGLSRVKDVNGQFLHPGGFSVYLERDTDPSLPKAGDEVFIKIIVSLKNSKTSSSALAIGTQALTVESRIVIYPREMGSFALVVPHDLYLNKQWTSPVPEKGDVSIHQFASRNDFGVGKGLVFQSPVFVNHDIQMTQFDPAKTPEPPYTPVTFADRVYLGNGALKFGTTPYYPLTAGNFGDRYWSDAKSFGGFLRGLENDGGSDAGLEAFRGASVNLSGNTMAQCIDLDTKQSNRALMDASAVGGSFSGNNNGWYSYLFALNGKNQFSPQSNQLILDSSRWNSKIDDKSLTPAINLFTSTASLSDAAATGAIINLIVTMPGSFGDPLSVNVQLPSSKNNPVTATLTLPTASQAYYDSVVDFVAKANEKANKAASDAGTALNGLTTLKAQLLTAQAKLVSANAAANTASNASASAAASAQSLSASVTATAADITAARSAATDAAAAAAAAAAAVVTASSQVTSLTNQVNTALTNFANLSTALTQYQAAATLAQKKLDDLKLMLKSPPQILATTQPYIEKSGKKAVDKVYVKFQFNNMQNLLSQQGAAMTDLPSIDVVAYDNSYAQSKPIGPYMGTSTKSKCSKTENCANPESTSSLKFTFKNGSIVYPQATGVALPQEMLDLALLQEQCTASKNSQTSQAFGSAAWLTDFSKYTRVSWNFAGDKPAGSDPVQSLLSITNSKIGTAGFTVKSIVGKCTIEADSDFVTGFFSCDELEIKSRTTPLRIIATFIVNKLSIHPSALQQGITWSSIYHPQATQALRKAGVLKSLYAGRSCDSQSNIPIWHPIPAVKDVQDRFSCNVISLREKANPFQWTSMDPDCGLVGAGAAATTCKHRLVRFFVVEQVRVSNL